MIERKHSFLSFFNKNKTSSYFNGAVRGDAVPRYGCTEANQSYIEKMLNQSPTLNYNNNATLSLSTSRADKSAKYNKVGRSQTLKQKLNYHKTVYSKPKNYYRSATNLDRDSYLEDSKNYEEIFAPTNVNHNNYSDYTRKLLLLTSKENGKKNRSVKEFDVFKETDSNPDKFKKDEGKSFAKYVKNLKRRLTKSKKSDFHLPKNYTAQQSQAPLKLEKGKSEDKDVQSSSFIDSGINIERNTSNGSRSANRPSRQDVHKSAAMKNYSNTTLKPKRENSKKDHFYRNVEEDLNCIQLYGTLTKNDRVVTRKFQFKKDFEKIAPSPPKDKIDSGIETRETSKEKKVFVTSESSDEQDEYANRSKTVNLNSNPYRARIAKRADSKNRSLSPKRKGRQEKEEKYGSSINIWQASKISDKIKKETEHHVIKTQKQQLNLLMHKTTKWVITQDFHKYRGPEHGARHEDQNWADA